VSDPLLVRALRREPVERTPVWFMRQAGRSLPEYRDARQGTPMLEACRTPDLVTEITLQPVRRHGVDAAIFFSDIVVPLAAVGVDIDIVPGTGPVVAKPVRSRADLDRLPELTADQVPDIAESVRRITQALGGTPLIGFAGAPFTLASYLVEGGPSRNHEHTKALMYGDPALWDDLCARLAQISGAFLRVQAQAGAGQYTDELHHIDGALDSLLKVRDVVAKAKTWPWEPDALRVVLTAVLLPILIWAVTRVLERLGV
jgi:uroporphyrinogen decarboxylase